MTILVNIFTRSQLGWWYIFDLCKNFGQFQPPIGRMLDHKTTQIWWLMNMEYKHLKLCLLYFDDFWSL